MFLAFDDTDSVTGMCTTYLTSEIILRTDLDVIGYPSLVRLNPNIGFKTRGNGAVSLRLGKGGGERFIIGRLDGRNIYGFSHEEKQVYDEHVLDIAGEVISEFAVMNDEKTNPGVVISPRLLSEELYHKALQTEVPISEAEKSLLDSDGKYMKFKLGRGVVGSSASLGWRRRKVTYELLSYRYPKPDSIEQEIKMAAASYVDGTYPSTFNNVDMRNRHAAIFPTNRTPVVYGIRSVESRILPDIEREMGERFGIEGSRYLIYETNQGTDDHIIMNPGELREGGSYSLEGEIMEIPHAIRGGHYFSTIKWKGYRVGLVAFEPTKEFREIFRDLRPGDIVNATGSMAHGNLKLEKLRVVTTSRFFRRSVPVCRKCGSVMKNHGKNDYRCRFCGSRSAVSRYLEEKRSLVPGNYEVPVSARRHLSMPFSLQDHFSVAGVNQEGRVSL